MLSFPIKTIDSLVLAQIKIRMFKFISLSVFILFSCEQTKPASKEITETFNKKEIRDLEKIVKFFSLEMCGKDIDFEECMNNSISELTENGWQLILQNIDIKNQLNLYKSFESNIFKEIWSFCKTSNSREGWIRKSICYQTQGKYNEFLSKVGQENAIVKAYQEDLIRSGDFYGIMRFENEIYHKTGKISLADPNIQIILAIEYLSENDHEKRAEPWSAK
jgi:hypothetical protein